MKNVVGLLEFTVTGAFFWLVLAFLSALVGIDHSVANGAVSPSDIVEDWLQFVPAMDNAPRELLGAAGAGLFFIAIFSTGFLLDLVAPLIFAVIETRMARQWMLLHSPAWLEDLVRQHRELVLADFESLRRAKGTWWRPVEWEVGKYRRLMVFFTSYVLATSKDGQQAEFLDRVKAWRVSEAMALSLLLLALGITAWVTRNYQNANVAMLGGAAVAWAIYGLAWVVLRETFFRVLIALEAGAYLGWKKAGQPAVAEPPPAREAPVRKPVPMPLPQTDEAPDIFIPRP
jgi:hypothetical protein